MRRRGSASLGTPRPPTASPPLAVGLLDSQTDDSPISRGVTTMPEAVIVATARTPIGRANKGSLVECRPDDLAGVHHQGGARQGAEPRPADRRGRDPGLRPARRRGGVQHRPRGGPARRPARRPRGHRQPVLLLVAADHPHGRPRHQGRRGRRLRRRRRRDRQPLHERRGRHRPAQRAVRRRRGRHRRAHPGRQQLDPAAPASPTSTSPWARRPRTSCSSEGVSREEMDEFGARSQQRAVAAQEHGFFDREITPVTTPSGAVVTKDDGPRAGTTVEKLAELQAGVPSRRQGHGRQRLPAQRRRRRGRRHERHPGRGAGHQPAGPHRGLRA